MTARLETTTRPLRDARQRILESAYLLFSRRGIRDVGIDEVIDRANGAKAILYRISGRRTSSLEGCGRSDSR